MSKTGIIRIKNAIFYGYHGVHTSEQNSGGRFEVDVDLYCDISDAMQTDSLLARLSFSFSVHAQAHWLCSYSRWKACKICRLCR